MKKILISWIAADKDFKLNSSEVSGEGPTAEIHKKEEYCYDEHIIFYADKKDAEKAENLVRQLKRWSPDRIITKRCLDVDDIYDVKKIKTRVDGFIKGIADQDIYIFTPPGTKAMFAAWFLVAIQGYANIHLIQIRDKKYVKKDQYEIEEIEIQRDSFTGVLLGEKNIRKPDGHTFITKSLERIYQDAHTIAQTDRITLLIKGDTGTGKEHLANYFHQSSIRNSKIFTAINCTAFNDELLLSELFGHVKGAFTGAIADKIGIFEKANGGTVFMDEIGDISPRMQAVLLRFLNDLTFIPVGSTEKKEVDLNLVFATNKDLEEECEKGNFRKDLYYRICWPDLELPSIQEMQPEEKFIFINKFVEKYAAELKRDEIEFDSGANELLTKYHFPGNIREIEMLIFRFYALNKGGKITIKDFPKVIFSRMTKYLESDNPLDICQKKIIEDTLIKCNYNLSKSAQKLNISLNTLKTRIQKYNITLPKNRR